MSYVKMFLFLYILLLILLTIFRIIGRCLYYLSVFLFRLIKSEENPQPTVIQMTKKTLHFMEAGVSLLVHNSPTMDTILSQMNPVHILTPYF